MNDKIFNYRHKCIHKIHTLHSVDQISPPLVYDPDIGQVFIYRLIKCLVLQFIVMDALLKVVDSLLLVHLSVVRARDLHFLQTHTHAYTHNCTHTYTCAHTCTHTYPHTHAYTHAYTHTQFTHAHTHTRNTHT